MRTLARTHLVPSITALALLALLLPATARAQETPADLRRENDALRNRVSQLEALNEKLTQEVSRLRERTIQLESQLARLQSEVPSLRKENAALRKQVRELGLTPVTEEDEDSSTRGGPAITSTDDLPANPLACPPSLFQALKTAYADRFADRSPDDNRAEYIKDVRRWALDMKRQFRDRVTWAVEITSLPGDDNLPTKLRVVDPETLEPYHGEAVSVDLGFRNTRRILAEPDTTHWILEGVFWAEPEVNPERREPGAIDYPPLIGPFAEFDFGLSVRSIVPAEES